MATPLRRVPPIDAAAAPFWGLFCELSRAAGEYGIAPSDFEALLRVRRLPTGDAFAEDAWDVIAAIDAVRLRLRAERLEAESADARRRHQSGRR